MRFARVRGTLLLAPSTLAERPPLPVVAPGMGGVVDDSGFFVNDSVLVGGCKMLDGVGEKYNPQRLQNTVWRSVEYGSRSFNTPCARQ